MQVVSYGCNRPIGKEAVEMSYEDVHNALYDDIAYSFYVIPSLIYKVA